MGEGELIRWDWIVRNLDDIGERVGQHILLAGIALVVGFAISFSLALLASRERRLIAPITAVTGILYTIPSLAAFAFLVPITRFSLLTAEIPLIAYTLLIFFRNTIAGLDSVPADIREAAEAMGYGRMARLWRVELPLALPVIIAGARIAAVTTIGLVTVAGIVGQGGLGRLIVDDGLRRDFPTALYVGAFLSVALAVIADLALLGVQRLLTPWSRAAGR
jgi:osmoprotectant transport system permease protein